jgi:uncharacterized transporter YbjL
MTFSGCHGWTATSFDDPGLTVTSLGNLVAAVIFVGAHDLTATFSCDLRVTFFGVILGSMTSSGAHDLKATFSCDLRVTFFGVILGTMTCSDYLGLAATSVAVFSPVVSFLTLF